MFVREVTESASDNSVGGTTRIDVRGITFFVSKYLPIFVSPVQCTGRLVQCVRQASSYFVYVLIVCMCVLIVCVPMLMCMCMRSLYL